MATGRNPAEARAGAKHAIRAARAAPTVADLVKQFLADCSAKQQAATVAEYRRFLARDVLPSLGQLKVAEASRAHVAKLHLALRDRPYLANRALAVLAAMFRSAEFLDLRAPHTNPCTGIAPYPEQARERFLSDADFASLSAAPTRAEREGLRAPPKLRRTPARAETAKHRPKTANAPQPVNPVAVAALRFVLLWGWRESEALGLRWHEIDFARRLAILSNTNTGRSARCLSAPALALVERLPRVHGNPYVFPGGTSGDHLRELKRVWEAVRHAAGLPEVRLHDLRHALASVAVGQGVSLPMIGVLLGHTEVSTTQRYAHLAAEPLRRAADDVGRRISLAMSGEPAQSDPNGTRMLLA